TAVGGAAEVGDTVGADAGHDGIGQALVVAVGREPSHEHLVGHDIVDDDRASAGTELVGEPVRQSSSSVDKVGNTLPAEGSQGCVHAHAAGTAGEFGDPVHRVACVRALFEVTGLHAHRGPVRGRVPADRDAAVVGDVEQLVSVGGPGVESVEAVDTIGHGG